MSEWVRVDPRSLPRWKADKPRGVHFHVFVSPYDVPDAVRGFQDPDTRRFVIEFRYIGSESVRMEPQTQHVVLRVGKHSGRLYGLEIDVEALNAKEVGLTLITSAIDRLAQQKPDRKENYEVAKEVINAERDLILRDLVPA